MSDRLELRGLRGRGRHGVLPVERDTGQVFVVDAVLTFDTRPAAATDDLRRTVDYAALARRLVDIVEGEPVDLIETLADRLAKACLSDERVAKVRLRVHKSEAPIAVPFDDVTITVTRARQPLPLTAPVPDAGPRQTAVVALGSNLGDRLRWLQRGLDLLAAHDDLAITAVSPVYETEPLGGPDAQDRYLNAVAALELSLAPAQLLGLLHTVEAACDRVRDVRWGPRTLDLDLIVQDDYHSAEPPLTLPHPRAHQRAFVLAPWADIDPAAALTGHGRVAELLRALDQGGVRRREDIALRVPR